MDQCVLWYLNITVCSQDENPTRSYKDDVVMKIIITDSSWAYMYVCEKILLYC